jgi:hypothetical protein
MTFNNIGRTQQEVDRVKSELKRLKKNHLIIDSEDNSDEYVNFQFVGMYEGREVVYDAVIYTLRLAHHSELYDIAEHKAAKAFPDYRKIEFKEDENGDLKALNDKEEEIGLFMAEVMMELEEEGSVKVSEHVEIDEGVEYGIGMDVGLNVEIVDEKVISDFVTAFNEDNLKLDDTLYTFVHDEEEEFDN